MHTSRLNLRRTRLPLACLAAAALVACGGGSDQDPAVVASAPSDGQAVQFSLAEPIDAAAADVTVLPHFHAAPVALEAPDDADAVDNATSSRRAAHTQPVLADLAELPTGGLTRQSIDSARRSHAAGVGMAPQATTTSVVTYTPAQVRAAYGLPSLPVAGATLSAAQMAQFGAGQTIYIVNARHDPNIAAELAAFNQKFGLPGCASKAIASNTALPLAAAAPTDGCVLSVAYATAAGGMTATAPAYDSGWATEIALDVQWAHAIAPLARIVLIEAADATSTQLVGAIQLANAMGPGVVSMSFGAAEGSWTASVDAAFGRAGMSYLAATGDSGAGVSWPAVSPRVLAVGGTRLAWSGSGTRSESAWSLGGGGISQYTAKPSYQTNAVPGMGSPARRALADVAFNADPYTGQYVATMPAAGGTPSWISAGGTSLATPQWAGLLAIANAVRAQAGKAPLGAPHAALYASIASVPGNYAAAFGDITSGSNGGCATCAAKTGYDTATGLGTPNAQALVSGLSGVAAATSTTTAPAPTPTAPVASSTTAPVISAPPLAALAGKPLSASIAISSPAGRAMVVTVSGIPAGMALSGNAKGLSLYWANPVKGNYALKITARDSAGLTTQATQAIGVAAK